MGQEAIRAKLGQLEWELSVHTRRLKRLVAQKARLEAMNSPQLPARIAGEKRIIEGLKADIAHLRSRLSRGGLPGASAAPAGLHRNGRPTIIYSHSDGMSLDGMAWENAEVTHITGLEKPHSRENKLGAYAIARLVGCEPSRLLALGHSYTFEAGVSLRPLEGFKRTRIKIPRQEGSVDFDIAILAMGMIISPTWLQSVRFEPKRETKAIVQFILVPTEIGQRQIRVEFYHQRHWLAQIKLEVEILEALESVLV